MSPVRKLDRLLRGPHVESYQFRHLEEDLSTLASLDLLLSMRLHAAVVALAYGVPVIPLFVEDKTSVFFRELGLGRLLCRHAHVPWLSRLLASRTRLDAFLAGYPHPDTATLARESRGHLELLTRLVAPPPATAR